MGLIETKIALVNPDGNKKIEETALVDTGTTLTVLPRRIANTLGLKVKSPGRVMTAGGPLRIDLSSVRIDIQGKSEIVRVAISDVIDKILIGVATLETLGLAVDPVKGELQESMYLLF